MLVLALVLGLALPPLAGAGFGPFWDNFFLIISFFFLGRESPGTLHQNKSTFKNRFVHPYYYMESPGETCLDKVEKQKWKEGGGGEYPFWSLLFPYKKKL